MQTLTACCAGVAGCMSPTLIKDLQARHHSAEPDTDSVLYRHGWVHWSDLHTTPAGQNVLKHLDDIVVPTVDYSRFSHLLGGSTSVYAHECARTQTHVL